MVWIKLHQNFHALCTYLCSLSNLILKQQTTNTEEDLIHNLRVNCFPRCRQNIPLFVVSKGLKEIVVVNSSSHFFGLQLGRWTKFWRTASHLILCYLFHPAKHCIGFSGVQCKTSRSGQHYGSNSKLQCSGAFVRRVWQCGATAFLLS